MSLEVSIYSRARSPFYYASYNDPDLGGKRVHRATEFRVDDPQGRKKAYHWAQKKAAEIAAESEGGHASWGAWVPRFIDQQYARQEKTRKEYQNRWDWLMLYLDEKKVATPRALTYEHVRDYPEWRMALKKRSGKSVTFNTALMEIKLLHLVIEEAIKRGYAEKNVAARTGFKKEPSPEKPEMTDAEIAAIRKRLVDEKWPEWMLTSFELALHQCCRLQETRIAMRNVNLREGTILLHRKGRNGKPKIHTVPIHPKVRPMLEKFAAEKRTFTCDLPPRASIHWHWFFKGRDEPGHKWESFLPHLTFHCTRVTVITRWARAGVPISQAMRFAGHAREEIHRVYQRLQVDDLKACLAAISYADTGASPQSQGSAPATP